ncbi:MAG: hypothetical protein ACXWDN_13255 [Limisphaerales bacterium]
MSISTKAPPSAQGGLALRNPPFIDDEEEGTPQVNPLQGFRIWSGII